MTGVVLLDEIDLHLHPEWQRRIIAQVRAIFRRMTFVVTTHNPATLVGARAEEIWILRTENGRVRAVQRSEAPKLLSGSELYNTYFGVPYLVPELAGKMQRYGFLAGSPARTDEEETEVQRLLQELRKEGVDPGWEPVARKEQGRPRKHKGADA
jgi:ABC-type multidrug transport system ATPase subunit